MANVAFLGLGSWVFRWRAGSRKKGHNVTVYNRTAAKAERWCTQHGGKAAATPAAAAQGAEIVFSCVGDDPDLREIALGSDGVIAAMRAGAHLLSITRRPRPTSRARLRRPAASAACTASTRRCRAARPAPRTASSRSWSAARPSAFATAEPVIRSFAQAVRLHRAGGLGPAHEDGQPDRDRGRRAGPRRGVELRAQGGPRRRRRSSRRSRRAPRNRGRWRTAGRR